MKRSNQLRKRVSALPLVQPIRPQSGSTCEASALEIAAKTIQTLSNENEQLRKEAEILNTLLVAQTHRADQARKLQLLATEGLRQRKQWNAVRKLTTLKVTESR